MKIKEATLFKLESNDFIEADTDTSGNDLNVNSIEFELLSPIETSDPRLKRINAGLKSVEDRLAQINEQIDQLNSEIESLTNHADWLDYTIAVASGIIAGIIDSVWVGEFSIDRANKWGDEKVENFVVKIAQNQDYKGKDLEGAIRHLEEKFPIAADKATNAFGGGLQHHLRDFSHHPTPVGLFFSLLTQFTGKVYGTDVSGIFKIATVDAAALIGKNLPEKLTFGVIHWFFHMVSDIAGSSTSVGKGLSGTGLPGPLVSLLKEVSALPIFSNMNENGYKEFSVWISKLFNGTLLGKRDENGKLIDSVKFDLRTEIGAGHEIGRQAIPVIVNECIVRGFYFVRRLFDEIRDNDIKKISDLKNINWKKTLPFKNRTIARMLTISTGTFTAFDMADALIRSGGINPTCILRINFVGVGRFAVAVVTDIGMGIKKSKKEYEKMHLISEQLHLLDAKIFYKQADMWICAEETGKSITEVYELILPTLEFTVKTWKEIHNTAQQKIPALLEEGREDEDDAAIAFILDNL